MQLEIQIFYMMPAPGHSPEALKQPILRTFHTASSVLRNALELDQKIGFLGHITHLQMRSLTTASCVIFKLLRSSYRQFLDRNSIEETTASDAIAICQRMSVMEGDLPMRLATLLRMFLESSRASPWTRWQNQEPTVTSFPHRLGASVAFDCLLGWKSDGTLKRALDQQQQQQQQQQVPNPPLTDAAATVGEGTDTILPGGAVLDPLAIDWTFMDDFEWAMNPPNLGPPVNLWHGLAR
jgi:transcriptional regulatory protein LEU3